MKCIIAVELEPWGAYGCVFVCMSVCVCVKYSKIGTNPYVLCLCSACKVVYVAYRLSCGWDLDCVHNLKLPMTCWGLFVHVTYVCITLGIIIRWF